MRLYLVAGIFILMAGVAAAQDTNFPVGPQYLITYGSPQFLHSIETPSLDLNAPPASIVAQGSSQAEAVPSPVSSQNEANLPQIYWGEAQQAQPAPESRSEIEMTAPQPDLTLPESFFNVGVTAIVSDRSLAVEGYGESLAQAAAYWKAHRARVTHVYTNADIARLHGG